MKKYGVINETNKLTKNKALNIVNQVNKLAGLDILENTRQREYVEARSLVCFVLRKYLGLGLNRIAKFFKENGKNMHHATALHLIRNYDIYKLYNKNLEKWFDMIINDIDDVGNENKRILIKHRIKYLTNKDIDDLALYTEGMYNKVLQREESI
tara:strand:+ start:1907 stop:2368 length:462 start_codon:yes stop_codon:yes gene_type:complete